MDLTKFIGFLLKYSSPNIQYRIKREIYGWRSDSLEMQELQERVLQLPKVKKAFATQRPDGFLGTVIHGSDFDGFDSTLKYASLEPSWRKRESILCDLYFPLVLELNRTS